MIDTVTHTAIEGLMEQATAQGRRLVVGAGIRREMGLLLVHRIPQESFLPNLWEIPGGKVRPHETLEDALAREILEETRLTLHGINSYIGHFDYDFPDCRYRQFTFQVETDSADPLLNPEEHDDFLWITQRIDLPMTAQMRAMIDVLIRQQKTTYAVASISA